MINEMIPVVYGIESPQAIPTIWRETICEIVEVFKGNDLSLLNNIKGVRSIDLDYAKEICLYVKDYGASLVSLPNETWNTSECLWLGDLWSVFIDLYTKEEGRSDLILAVKVFEINHGFEFLIESIYVP